MDKPFFFFNATVVWFSVWSLPLSMLFRFFFFFFFVCGADIPIQSDKQEGQHCMGQNTATYKKITKTRTFFSIVMFSEIL